ncbi:MAG TPA: helicase C-terminal domain-containing protein [Nitrososphaerales archaeon]
MKFCDKCGSRLKFSGNSYCICVKCGEKKEVEDSKEKPTSLLEHFPHKSLRRFQEKTLIEIESALKTKKFIILEAPVGFGKSAVAATLCNYLGSAHIVTATKQLQDQYASDFSYPLVKGKSNFQCYVSKSTDKILPCSKGRCEVDWKLNDCPNYISFQEYEQHRKKMCNSKSKCENLKDEKLCTYYAQKWHGYSSPIAVYNYSFLLSELRFANDLVRRKLIVFDEVHELERQMVDFLSFRLSKNVLQYYHDALKSRVNLVIPHKGLDDAFEWLDVLDKSKQILEVYLEIYSGQDQEADKVASCKNLLDDLVVFITRLRQDRSNWIVNSVKMDDQLSVQEVVFQPLKVGSYTSQIFKIADKFLLMSATIFSSEILCNSLGIPISEAHLIKVEESTFPLENRPVYALNTTFLNRASINTSLETISKAVDKIMQTHSNERGVIHTTSYMQARYISEHVSENNRKRLINTEETFDKSLLIKIHSSNDASVLISPSLYQGVDLKDELSRFQIIVKVPYPDLSERRTRIKLERDQLWYSWQTAQRLLQAYGRSVRSEKDHAVTYVLDSNFTRFLNSNRNLFPKYFLDAIKSN